MSPYNSRALLHCLFLLLLSRRPAPSLPAPARTAGAKHHVNVCFLPLKRCKSWKQNFKIKAWTPVSCMNSSWPSLVAAADQQVLIRHLNTQIHCRMKRVIAFCLLINREHRKPLFFLMHGIKHLTAVQWSDQELIDSLIQICSSTLSKLSALLNVFSQKQQNTADYLERRAFLVSSHVKVSLTDLRTITF